MRHVDHPAIRAIGAAALAGGLVAAVPAVAQPPQPAPPMSTATFLQAAAGSDQFEITEAQTALGQSRNPQVRAFAEAMIRDHTADAEGLRQAAESAGLPPPKMAMTGDQAKLLSGLQALRGHDFDADYAKQQGLAHTQALVVTQAYASGGPDPAVRRAAQKAVPMIQHHLEMAQQIKAAIGGS
jgi:putative membrane protein